MRVLSGMLGFLILMACSAPPRQPEMVLGDPVPGLDASERGRFLLGRALFERLVTPEEGLGPLFNAERCSACHEEPVVGGGGAKIPVLKATRFHSGVCDPLEDWGGDNIQLRATDGLLAHGSGPETIPHQATASVQVTGPPLFGLGLLEAIPVADLEGTRLGTSRQGEVSSNLGSDPFPGRLPRLPEGSVARFGRKGDAASVREFVETALIFELGLTTPAFPEEQAVNGVPIPPAADPVPDPEFHEEGLGLLVDYVRYLAPPSREAHTSPAQADSVRRGERLFEAVGCINCHTPTWTTGRAPESALTRQTIHPYTDLRLHDLGGGDRDVCTGQALPGEYRTAPLWGLRHRRTLLHDGSATTPEDAISAHGGQAASAAAAFFALSRQDQAFLLRFLASL